MAALRPSTSEAQAIAPTIGRDAPDRRVWFEPGWDPTWVAGFGGSYAAWLPRNGMRIDVDMGARVPIVLGFDAWQFAAGATTLFITDSGMGVALGVHPDLRLAHDAIGTKLGIGGAVGARPGYYGKSWTLALDALASVALTTHVWHSNEVRDLFNDRYPTDAGAAAINGPRDGWYRATSHRLRLGLAGGMAVSKLATLHATAGFVYTPHVGGVVANPPIGPMPFFATLGGAIRW